MMSGIVEQFAANEVLPTILLMGVAAVLAWRDLGYVRHIRRIAEIEQRLALRNGNLASSSVRHPSRVRHPHQRRHCRASGPGRRAIRTATAARAGLSARHRPCLE